MVVGPDMTGKTQIAKELSKRTGIPYFKASSERTTYLETKVTRPELFLNQLLYADPRAFDLAKQVGFSMVMDRAYPCEAVYSQVMERKTDMDAIHVMDGLWASLGAKIVICYRSSYEGIVDDIDEKITAPVLKRLTEAYFAFSDWTRCDVLRLNVDDEDLNREVEEICLWLDGCNKMVVGETDG
jgi:hypothetical protein